MAEELNGGAIPGHRHAAARTHEERRAQQDDQTGHHRADAGFRPVHATAFPAATIRAARFGISSSAVRAHADTGRAGS